MKRPLSRAALLRMPEYCRVLRECLSQGEMRVSSSELAEKMQNSPSQVRQDLGGFAGCGIQGYGYATPKLYQAVCAYLGITDEFSAVILGGLQAAQLASFPLFSRYGIRLRGVFSGDPAALTALSQVTVSPFAEWEGFCRREQIPLLILASVVEDAPAFLEQAVAAGVRGILNLSERPLPQRKGIVIRNLSVSGELMLLCYALKQEGGSQ